MAKVTEDYYNIERLVGVENYQIWKFQIKVLFRANEVLQLATENTEVDRRNDAWKKKDAIAQKIIISTLDKKPFLHIMDCETSYEMWRKISNTYERDTEQQRCKLLQEFYSISYEKDTDMSSYISKIKNLTYRLNAIDTKIDDKMLISKLLATLPKEYSYFISAWESTKLQRKTLDNLTARLIEEEQRHRPKEEEEAIAFKSSYKKCNICNKAGHLAKFCRAKASNKDKKQVRCYKCNKIGHIAKNCKEDVTRARKDVISIRRLII